MRPSLVARAARARHDVGVGDDADPEVDVRLAPDGQVEHLDRSPRDGAWRVVARGLRPSEDHPFGLSGWDEHRVIGTVVGSVDRVVVDRVVVELSDESSRRCSLRPIDGADASWFVVELPEATRPRLAVAESRDGTPLGVLRFHDRLLR